jgi:hypothetical protein
MWSSIRRRWSIWSCRFDHFRRSLTWWRSTYGMVHPIPRPFPSTRLASRGPRQGQFFAERKKNEKISQFPPLRSHNFESLLSPLDATTNTHHDKSVCHHDIFTISSSFDSIAVKPISS